MTPARPTVSVVVPVLDDAEHLRVCLALLAAQSRPALEVVVVDMCLGFSRRYFNPG